MVWTGGSAILQGQMGGCTGGPDGMGIPSSQLHEHINNTSELVDTNNCKNVKSVICVWCLPAPHPDDELLAVGVEEDLGGVVGAALVAEVELGVVDDDP